MARPPSYTRLKVIGVYRGPAMREGLVNVVSQLQSHQCLMTWCTQHKAASQLPNTKYLHCTKMGNNGQNGPTEMPHTIVAYPRHVQEQLYIVLQPILQLYHATWKQAIFDPPKNRQYWPKWPNRNDIYYLNIPQTHLGTFVHCVLPILQFCIAT